jgi:hypothetical protein
VFILGGDSGRVVCVGSWREELAASIILSAAPRPYVLALKRRLTLDVTVRVTRIGRQSLKTALQPTKKG